MPRYSAPKAYMEDSSSYNAKEETSALNRIINDCASDFYHKSSRELQEALHALEQGLKTANKNPTVRKLLELLSEKNSCFSVERKTLISFFQQVHKQAVVVENSKNVSLPQSTNLDDLVSSHRSKFYHTSDEELRLALKTLEDGSLQQIEKNPTITTLLRILRLENKCSEISRETARQFFEQISASASIVDSKDADNSLDEIDNEMTEDDTDNLFDMDMDENDAIYDFCDDEEADRNRVITIEAMLSTPGVSEFYKKSESSLQNTLYTIKHGTKEEIEKDSNVTALRRILKQQDNISNVTKNTLIDVFGTILDNRQSLKKSFKDERRLASHYNINRYHYKCEETNKKLNECHISKNSANHLKNILNEEDRKAEWTKDKITNPELTKLSKTLSRQKQDIERTIDFLNDTEINWDGKDALIAEHEKLRDEIIKAIEIFNNFIEYNNSKESPKEKVNHPLYNEHHNSEKTLNKLNQHVLVIDETNKKLSNKVNKYHNIYNIERELAQYKKELLSYEKRIEIHKEREKKNNVRKDELDVSIEEDDRNIEIDLLKNEIKKCKENINNIYKKYNHEEFDEKNEDIKLSLTEIRNSYYKHFIKNIDAEAKKRTKAIRAKISASRKRIERKLSFLAKIQTSKSDELTQNYINLKKAIENNKKLLKENINAYNSLNKLRKSDSIESNQNINKQLEKFEENLNTIEHNIAEIDEFESEIGQNIDDAIATKNEIKKRIFEINQKVTSKEENLSIAIDCVENIKVNCYEKELLIDKYSALQDKLIELNEKLIKHYKSADARIYLNTNAAINEHSRINNKELNEIENEIKKIDEELNKISDSIAVKQALYRNGAKATLQNFNSKFKNSSPSILEQLKYENTLSFIKQGINLISSPFKMIKNKIKQGIFGFLNKKTKYEVEENKGHKKTSIENLHIEENRRDYMSDLQTMFILDRLHFGNDKTLRKNAPSAKNQNIVNLTKNHASLIKEMSDKNYNQSRNSCEQEDNTQNLKNPPRSEPIPIKY